MIFLKTLPNWERLRKKWAARLSAVRELKRWRLKEDERTICANCRGGFIQPECEYEEYSAPAPDGQPFML